MTVHIQTLRNHERICRILKQNGWRLDQASGPDYDARNPAIEDQEAARSQLDDLGLLTSPSVRIEFDPHAD